MTSLAVLGAIIILGNFASIITFIKTQSLRRRSHYLIISLSAADLLVGVVAFMLLYYFLTGAKLNAYAFALDFLDTLTAMTSVLTLSAISVERFSAILFPFRHRMLRFRVYVALSSFPWILGTCLAVMNIISHFKRAVYYTFMHFSFVIIALALLTILISYISMGCKMRRQSNLSVQNQNRALRDKKLVITLLIVTLSSLVTWMPLQGYSFVKILCRKCPLPDSNDVFIMKFLQFCNSGLNLFIYMVRMTEFRVAFLAIFCRRKKRNIRPNNTTQKSNQAFTSDEGTRGTQSTIARTIEFDDLQDIEQRAFKKQTNVFNNQKNSTNYANNKIAVSSQANNNSQMKFNVKGEETFGKTNHEKSEMPMSQGHDEATQGSNEALPAHPENGSTSLEYEIELDEINDHDTPM